MDGSASDDLHQQRLAHQHWRAEYALWREKHLPTADALALLRSNAREAVEALRQPTCEWIQRTYGVLLPDYMFTFWTFWLGLSPIERRATERFVYPAGLFTFFDESGRERIPREGLDHRLAWRYYLDPPEFLTVLTGDADGLHYGLWYDNPRALPTCVAGYYSREADAIRIAGRTLLEVLRDSVERAVRDFYPPRNAQEAEDDLFPIWLLRDTIEEYETVDQRERGDGSRDAFTYEDGQGRLATCSGIGVATPLHTTTPFLNHAM